MASKVITLRLSPEVHRKAVDLAGDRQVSLNQLFKDALDALAAQDHQRRLYEDFSLLGSDNEASEIGFALDAQREIAKKP
jgi:hypothetical protein